MNDYVGNWEEDDFQWDVLTARMTFSLLSHYVFVFLNTGGPHVFFKRMQASSTEGYCEISHRLERRTKHFLYGCGNLSVTYAF